MIDRNLFICATIAVVFCCCLPKLSINISHKQAPLPEDALVLILKENNVFINDGTDIGTLHVSDNGLSINCTYNEEVERIKQMARQSGANLVKITEFKPGGSGKS